MKQKHIPAASNGEGIQQITILQINWKVNY